MFTYLAIISLLSILYAYFGYPLILSILNNYNEPDYVEKISRPSNVTIIITTHNEEKHIKEKILNTLGLNFYQSLLSDELQSGNSSVQIIVADDASTDITQDIVNDFADAGVQLVKLSERGGKEKAQELAISKSSGEIIMFTDAKVFLATDALMNTLNYFSDPDTGAISSYDTLVDSNGTSGESSYIRYEMKIRELESSLSSLVGLSGSCFAVRSQIAREIDTSIPSDFSMLLACVKAGLRGKHAPDVIARYESVNEIDQEFKRKVRTVLRGMSALFKNTALLNPKKFGFFAFQLISHKLYRWLVPLFFIVLFVSCYMLRENVFWWYLFFVQSLFIIIAILAYFFPQHRDQAAFKIPLYLATSNLAILIAWFKFFKGSRVSSWNPSNKGGI